MSVHQTKDGRWYCVWYEKKRRYKKYFGRGDIARYHARRFDDEIKKRKGKLLKTLSLTVMDVCHAYHIGHPVEISTAKNDVYKLKVMLPFLGHLPVETLTSNDINKYVRKRLSQGVKRATIVREIGLLKAALNWAERQDPPLIHRNPLTRYKMPKITEKDVPPPPNRGEIQKILKHAEPHLVRAIKLCWYCGLRPGNELLSLKWQDADLEEQVLRVQSARKGGPVIRYVPIPDALKWEMMRWKEEDGKNDQSVLDIPIVHYRFKPVASLKRSWKTAKRKARISRKMRMYDLRHAMVTLALRSGADLKSVSEVIGHSRPDTTLREYQHVTQKQHRQVVENIPILFGEHSGKKNVGA